MTQAEYARLLKILIEVQQSLARDREVLVSLIAKHDPRLNHLEDRQPATH